MEENIFIIRIPDEDMMFTFKVKSAEITIEQNEKTLEFGINVFADEKEFEENNYAEPFASLGSIVLPYENSGEIFDKGINIENGYDEEGTYSPYDNYLTDLYFLEHLILNNNKINFNDLSGDTVKVHWTGTANENQDEGDDNIAIEINTKAKIFYDKEFIRPY